jgi:NADH-quinone oxidoreductase subunit C
VSGTWDLDDLERALGASGVDAVVTEAFGDVTVAVSSDRWVSCLSALRDDHGLGYFDWLSAVDEGDDGFSVYCHLYDTQRRRHLLARTTTTRAAPSLPTVTSVFRGAAWHERETHEMFGIDFVGHPYLAPLLLSDEFEGHPLRKDFVLTARASKSWPGAKEPGESSHEGAPSRRKMQPPGVPDPSWGPREVDDA